MPVQIAAGLVDLSQCGMLVIRHERNHAGEALVTSQREDEEASESDPPDAESS
jgi:hypothetical protein